MVLQITVTPLISQISVISFTTLNISNKSKNLDKNNPTSPNTTPSDAPGMVLHSNRRFEEALQMLEVGRVVRGGGGRGRG